MCQYAKQSRKTSPGSTKRNDPDVSGDLKRNRLFPGQLVLADYFFANPLSQLLMSFGKESVLSKFTGGVPIWDHATGYTKVMFHADHNSYSQRNAV